MSDSNVQHGRRYPFHTAADWPLPRRLWAVLRMQLIRKHEEEILQCFTGGERDRQRCMSLMKQDEHVVGMDDPGVRAQGSELAYHVACVRLLADVCIGKEPTFIVQSTGYLTLANCIDMMLLPSRDIKASTMKFLQVCGDGWWTTVALRTGSRHLMVATLAD